MIQTHGLEPSPFFLAGGPMGVLLLHGFTGAPPEMRLLGDYLHQRGFTVLAPLLPGHGTSVDDLNTCRWTDWTAHAERCLAELRDRCSTVFVGGLSMGALLALDLAAHHPDLPAIATYSPALKVAERMIYLTPILKYFIRKQPKDDRGDPIDTEVDGRIWSYHETPVAASAQLLTLMTHVERALPRVTNPLLVVYSTEDRTIRADSARLTYERAGSRDKRLVTLHGSGHCVTVDNQWETVARATAAFFEAHA